MARAPASLRARLLLLTLLALLPAVGLTVASALEARGLAVADAFEELGLLAATEARDQEALLDGARQALVLLAHLPAVERGEWAACDAHLATLLPHLPGYLNLGVADVEGFVVCSAVYPDPRPDPPVGIADRPHIQGALASRDFAVGAYQVGRATGRPSLNVGYPVLAQDGTLRGVAFAALDASSLVAMVTDAPLAAGGSVLLLDRAGTVVTRFPEPGPWPGRNVTDSVVVRAVMAGGLSGLLEGPGLDGVDRLQAYQRVPARPGAPAGDAPLIVVVSMPRESILAPVQASFARNLAAVGLVAAVTLLAVALVTRRHVLEPVADLRALAARLGNGEFGARLARAPRVPEFAELGRALEGMAARVGELDRMKTRFINMAAHELGTPMTPIKLQTRILRDRHLRDDRSEVGRSLDILDRNVARLDRLIRDVLVGARVQASALSMQREPMDLDAVAGEAVEAYRGAAQDAGLALDYRPGAPPPVLGDRMRLGQVLDNLLANALKFTPPGGRVEVTTSWDGGLAVVRVADTGVGLRAEDLPRLFQPFSQLEDPMQRTGAGAGLGLYICKGIVEAHGGRVWAQSDGPDRGSVFVVELPALAPGRASPEAAAARDPLHA